MERTRIFQDKLFFFNDFGCLLSNDHVHSTHDKNMDLSIDFTTMKESDLKALRNRALVASRASLLW